MSRVDKLLSEHKEYTLSRDIFFNYLEEYETFSSSVLKHTRSILLDHNTAFNFERKGNNREGAYTQKYMGEKVAGIHLKLKVIKVRKDAEFALQLHTYFHELAHLVNNHNEQHLNEDVLSKPQKEYVAETVAQALLYSFAGGMTVDELPSNGKWDHSQYVEGWIKNAKFSDAKINEMWRQIEYSYQLVKEAIITNTN